MKCLRATRLLSEAMDRPLAWQEQVWLKVHLSMCRGCREFSLQMPVLRQISQRYANGDAEDEEPRD